MTSLNNTNDRLNYLKNPISISKTVNSKSMDEKRKFYKDFPDTFNICKQAVRCGFRPIPLEFLNKFYRKKGGYFDVPDEEIAEDIHNLQHICNVAILTGKRSNVIVIDVDLQNNGIQNWDALLKENGITNYEDFKTPYVQTPSGGFHFYFWYDDETMDYLTKYTDVFAKSGKPGIDLLCNLGLAVYPGSTSNGCRKCKENKTGKCGGNSLETCKFKFNRYKWILSPVNIRIKEMPDWLFSLIQEHKPRKTKRTDKSETDQENHQSQTISEDFVKDTIQLLSIDRTNSYDGWRDAIWCLRAVGASVEDAHEFSKRSDKYEEKSVDRMWNSYTESKGHWNIYSLYSWLKDDLDDEEYKIFYKKYPLKFADKYIDDDDEILLFNKDAGLAEFFEKHMEKYIKIYDGNGNGFVWDSKSKLWIKREFRQMRGVFSKFIRKSVDTRLKELKEFFENNIPPEEQKDHPLQDKIKRYVTLKNYVRCAKGIRNTFTFCVDEHFFYHEDIQTQMNHAPDCIPLANQKILNFKTLEIRERTIQDLFSFSTDINFDSGACENAKQYFLTLCGGDEELVRYLQLILGYCMTGHTDERSIFVFWGEGRNGKSFLFGILQDILKKFMSSISEQVLLKNTRKGGATPELMTLLGKRLVYYSESEEKDSLRPGRVKALTGTDGISARALYEKHELSFKPICKIFLQTNHQPKFNINDQAMLDRIKLVPFLARFENTQENKNYADKVKTEYRDEIASFLIRGAHDWVNGAKILTPKISTEEMNSYILQFDSVQQFIQEKCEKGLGFFEPVSSFKNGYVEFCHTELREPPISRNALSKQMKKIFRDPIGKTINRKNIKCWRGLKITPE